MYKIPLTQGKEALVDQDSFEYLNQWNWYFSDGYAKRCDWKNGKHHIVRMHHFVLPLVKGYMIDHINGNGLDNRKENLRLVTKSQNMMNRGVQRNTSSGYKGVSKHQGKWRAYIVKDRKQIHLGVFEDIQDAARAYNMGAMEHHGEYARLNPIRA